VRPLLALGVFAVGVPLVLAGCGSDKLAAPSSAPPSVASATATDRTFVLNEFTVKLGSQSLSSGKVLLVKAAAITDLPTKADGSVDEDKIAETDKVGEIEHVLAHQTKSSTFQLDPGTYVAFCNLIDQMSTGSMMNGNMGAGQNMGSGHVHFAQGMYQLIVVK
jgi:hypothetical protein